MKAYWAKKKAAKPNGHDTAPERTATVPCDVCGHKFSDANTLQVHKTRMHAEPQKAMVRCEECGDRFPDAKSMGLHKTRTHFNSGGGRQSTLMG